MGRMKFTEIEVLYTNKVDSYGARIGQLSYRCQNDESHHVTSKAITLPPFLKDQAQSFLRELVRDKLTIDGIMQALAVEEEDVWKAFDDYCSTDEIRLLLGEADRLLW